MRCALGVHFVCVGCALGVPCRNSRLYSYATLKVAIVRTPEVAVPKPNAVVGIRAADARFVRSASADTSKSVQQPAAESVNVAVVLWW